MRKICAVCRCIRQQAAHNIMLLYCYVICCRSDFRGNRVDMGDADIIHISGFYRRVSHFPQNTVSLGVPVNSLLPQILSIAVRIAVLVHP